MTGICCKQIKIFHPQTLILIRDFNYSGISWKGSKVEHKQLRSCLESGKELLDTSDQWDQEMLSAGLVTHK